jgi:hypothetical protein
MLYPPEFPVERATQRLWKTTQTPFFQTLIHIKNQPLSMVTIHRVWTVAECGVHTRLPPQRPRQAWVWTVAECGVHTSSGCVPTS